MSAVRSRQQVWWDDDSPTQAIPAGAVRGSQAPLRAMPRPAGGQRSHVRAQARPATSFDPSRAFVTLLAITALAVLLYFGITSLLSWTQVKLDDMHYGRPRTTQIDAFVGHGEATGVPTHLVAMNLNRRVTILEFPGGDATKPQVIVGPYLFGRTEDLTVIKLRVDDINADQKPDLIVQVKDERLVYINDGATFRPITPEELARLKQQEGGR